MDKIVKGVEAVSPFLSSFPIWVRVVFVTWVFLSASLVVLLIFVPRVKSETKGRDIKSIEVLPDQVRATWGYKEVDRPLIRGLHHLFSEATVTTDGEAASEPKVVIVETDAFKSHYKGFSVQASSNFAPLRIGEAFIERETGELVQLRQRRLESAIEFRVPEVNPEDHLIAILRIETKKEITDDLLPSVIKLGLAED